MALNQPSNPNIPSNPMVQKPTSAFERFKAAIGFLWSNNNMFVEMSPQAETFEQVAPLSQVDVHSQVEKQIYQTAAANGYFTSQLAYRNFVYGTNFTNKPWRLASYRVIANSPEVSLALDEIADGMLNRNESEEYLEFKIQNQHLDSFQQQVLEDEFQNIYNMLDMETRGFEYCKRYLYEGELVWENIIDMNDQTRGIIGMKFVEPESYEYVIDVNNNVIGFMFNAMIQLNKQLSPQFQNYFNANPYFAGQVNGQIDFQSYANGTDGKILAMPVNQFTWVRDETNMNNNKTMIMPHVARVQQIWRRLLLLKDSLIIYRLVRAPMSRVFNVNVGTAQGNKVQAELQRFANMYKNKRVFSPQTGEIDADYDVHALTHNFFFAKDNNGHGTDVSNLEGGSPEFLKDLDDIKLVIRELYRGLKVPFDRWENASNESHWYMSEKMTYEEASFYKFIMRLQQSFAGAVKETYISHLRLTGLWEKYELIESDFSINMTQPPMFYAFIQKQAWLGKVNLFKETVNDDIGMFSKEFAAKQYLGLSEDEYQANVEQRVKEAIQEEMMKIRVEKAIEKAKAELENKNEEPEEETEANPEEEKKEATPPPSQQLPVEKQSIENHEEPSAEESARKGFKEFYSQQPKAEESPKEEQVQTQEAPKEEKEEPAPFEEEPEETGRETEDLAARAKELETKLSQLKGKQQPQQESK